MPYSERNRVGQIRYNNVFLVYSERLPQMSCSTTLQTEQGSVPPLRLYALGTEECGIEDCNVYFQTPFRHADQVVDITCEIIST